MPSAYEVIHGFAVVRDYRPLVDVSWEQARECVEAEGRWLDRAAAATDEEGFEAVLESAPEEESPEDFDYLFAISMSALQGRLSCWPLRTSPPVRRAVATQTAR